MTNNEDDKLSSNSDDFKDVTSNDTSDEDWVAVDQDKKRHGRLRNQSNSRKILNHHEGSSCDRSQRKPFGGASSRQYQSYQPGSRNASNKPNQSVSIGRSNKTGSVSVHQNSANKKSKKHTSKAQPNKIDLRKADPLQIPNELKKPRQCFGPGCRLPAARPDTKYCSEECGLKLAIKRLEILLPESLSTTYLSNNVLKSSGSITCVADEIDNIRLKEINNEQCSVQDHLIELEMEHQKLTALINKAQECKADQNDEHVLSAVAKDSEQIDQMEPIICVTCSTEVSMRHALKHMEKCFQKMEGNTVFCANQKEQIMGTPLFCDTYDSHAKAYCKRLRVVCEHYREPKLPSDTICGFPIVQGVFVETGEFCCIPRNKCTKHFGWERLRRAKIDLERYRCLIQMDELMQEEERLRRSISQRGGLLGILLHRTIDHNPSIQIQPLNQSKSTKKKHVGNVEH